VESLPGQQCKIPNNPTLSLGAGRKGCFILRFSRNGKSLACGCHDKDSYPIYIYEIPSGQLKGELTGHYRIIYDLCWSKSDHGLLSASADGTVRVWDIEKMARSSCKLLPHPSFVYTARYHSHVSKIVVTGGFDRLIRIWNLESDSNSGILLHELDGHLAFVNALCFNDDGDVLYSGDSLGNIHVWNVRVADTDAASAKGTQVTWSLQKEITHKDIVGNAINVLQTHPSGRRLLVHTRNNMIQMLDLRTDTVMCKYVGALNFREHIRSTLTPCGSFLFSGSEDGQAYVWNAESGDLVYIYSKLGFCNAVCDVTFHPLDNIVAFCSYGESHLIKLYSYDQKAVRKDLTFDVGEALGDTSLKGASPGLQTAENTVAPLGFMDTAMDLSLMQSARMHQVMAKLRSVSALHSTRRDEPSSGLDLTNASGATMTMMRSDWLPGSVGEQSSLLLSYRQPKINLTRTTGKSQLTVQDPLRRRDKPLEQVTVVYDYQAQRSDELSLKRGDRVNVLFKDNENWWMGELADGQQGFFPSNYVVEHESKLTRDSDVDTDTERQTKVHAVRTKSGELKFLSAAEDSDTDVPSNVQKRRMKSSGPVRRQESIDRKEIPSKRS
jgi:jouberin